MVEITLTVSRTVSGKVKPLTMTSRIGVVRNVEPLPQP
jgi:hypothetical protein